MTKPNDEVLDYTAVHDLVTDGSRTHLLIGNGFSIECDKIFSYGKLYDAAVTAGLSPRAQQVFGRIGTNNFEAVMRLLDDGHWLARTYKLIPAGKSEMQKDLSIIKKALVEAVAKSHIPHSGEIPDVRKKAASEFLEPYYNVFCTNYDLLVYWVNMFTANPPPYQDGFRADGDDPDAATLVFTERMGDHPGLFFVHGALHLFVGAGEVRKHCYRRSDIRLTSLIQQGLEAGKYPLFVAEGTWKRKLEQIRRSGYLSYCFDKLGRVQGRLVTFGFSFGENDTHIQNQIADNDKISELFVGILGDPSDVANNALVASVRRMEARRNKQVANGKGRAKPLTITYFKSATAKPWG